MEKWLAAAVVAAGIGSLSVVAAGDAPDGADGEAAAKLLEDAEAFLRLGRKSRAVRALRRVVENYEESRAASAARHRLAQLGFGLHCEVVLTDRAVLEEQDVRLADVVARVEALYEQLQLFFRQTYRDRFDHEFRIEIFDSRARFQAECECPGRRSEASSLPVGPSNLPRHLIRGYHDARIVEREDRLDILWESVAREMSRALLRRHTGRKLPEGLEVGLSEYLALRLFPRQLTRTKTTPEVLTRALAREGLGRVYKFADFQKLLKLENGPVRASPQVRVRIRAIYYAVVDLLLHGDLVDAPSPPGRRRPTNREPRIAQLQALLRDYEAHSFTLEQLLERHLNIELKTLHKSLVRHVQRYPRRPEGFEVIFNNDY